MQWREPERNLKSRLSSDCSLQLESMKQESLVIVDQHATVNSYLGLVLTARHALEIEWIGSFQGTSFLYCINQKFLTFEQKKASLIH